MISDDLLIFLLYRIILSLVLLCTTDFELPGGDPVPGAGVVWISDAVFSDFNFGYVARGITMFAKNWINKDALNTPPLQEPRSVSAVYVDHLNIFDIHVDKKLENNTCVLIS